MATLDERIAAREKRIAELQAEMRSLKIERNKRERDERRESERRARVQEQKDALDFWRLLHNGTVSFHGNRVNAYTFVEQNVLPSLVTNNDDDTKNSIG